MKSKKFQTVIKLICDEIVEGKLKPGQKLPSIRSLAVDLGCSHATVIHAYEELEKDHLIFAVAKSGYYLVEKKMPSMVSSNERIIDLASAIPDTIMIPYIDLQHCLNQAILRYKEDLFAYIPPQGLPSLRSTLASYFQDFQVFVKPENIIITSGSQQALHILAGLPFPNQKTGVLIEQPTYSGMIGACKQQNVPVFGIKRDFQGIDFEELERIFQTESIKFFYTVPRFHNPLGASYSNQQKKEILRMAECYDVYIVEDDYLADLEHDSKTDPIYAFDASKQRIIYVRSFSKTLMPGLRLGAVVLPGPLIPAFTEQKRIIDLSTSVLSQGGLEIYIQSGMVAKHNKRIKQFYQQKMTELNQMCQSSFPSEVHYRIPPSGLFALLEIPFNAERFTEELKKKYIKIIHLKSFYLPEFYCNRQIRISISQASLEDIQTAIPVIAEEIRLKTFPSIFTDYR